MVGALLSDLTPELAEGKRRVRARIAEQHGVTPHGVDGAPAYWQRYLATKDAFGRTQDLLCPYYSEGMCTVWHYREAVCATYYCKHDQGDDGHRFWMAVRERIKPPATGKGYIYKQEEGILVLKDSTIDQTKDTLRERFLQDEIARLRKKIIEEEG